MTRRISFTFRIKSLFVAILLLSFLFTALGIRIRESLNQQSALEYFSSHNIDLELEDYPDIANAVRPLPWRSWRLLENSLGIHEMYSKRISGLKCNPGSSETSPKEIDWKQLERLPYLQMIIMPENCGFDESTALAISRCSYLNVLVIEGPEVTDDSVSLILSNSKQITDLKLSDTSVSDKSIQSFLEYKGLRTLEIIESKITPDGAARLQKELPHCDVFY
ncbi:MAG: hypothetical protein U0894_05035 [Pirellulales bacterium]